MEGFKRQGTDDNLKRCRIPIVSRCCCCDKGCEESMNHLFLTAPVIIQLWEYFVSSTSYRIAGTHLSTALNRWWIDVEGMKARYILRSIPTILIWELRIRRNQIKHDKQVSYLVLRNRCKKNCALFN